MNRENRSRVVRFLVDGISLSAGVQVGAGIICAEPGLIVSGAATWLIGLPFIEAHKASNNEPQSNPPLGFQGPRA